MSKAWPGGQSWPVVKLHKARGLCHKMTENVALQFIANDFMVQSMSDRMFGPHMFTSLNVALFEKLGVGRARNKFYHIELERKILSTIL